MAMSVMKEFLLCTASVAGVEQQIGVTRFWEDHSGLEWCRQSPEREGSRWGEVLQLPGLQ